MPLGPVRPGSRRHRRGGAAGARARQQREVGHRAKDLAVRCLSDEHPPVSRRLASTGVVGTPTASSTSGVPDWKRTIRAPAKPAAFAANTAQSGLVVLLLAFAVLIANRFRGRPRWKAIVG